MVNKSSLKYQFKKQLAISVGLLILIFSLMLDQIFSAGIHSSMHRGMLSIARHYAQQVDLNADFNLPDEGEYLVFVGKDNIPNNIQALFDIDAMPVFGFAVNDGNNLIKTIRPGKLYFLVSHPLRNSSDDLYLFYNDRLHFSRNGLQPPAKQNTIVADVFDEAPRPKRNADFVRQLGDGFPPHAKRNVDVERKLIDSSGRAKRNADMTHTQGKGFPPPEKRIRSPHPEPGPLISEQSPLLSVPGSIAVITLLAIVLIYWVIQRLISGVLKPLNQLSIMAKSIDEKSPEQSFEVLKNKTEIGEVAKTLNQTMSRMHEYHQREKQFLKNASHELRTPIAVVGSALDIIELRSSQGKSNIADQLANIRRAAKSMAELTEALLFLNRNSSSDIAVDKLSLQELSTTLIKEHQYLITDKNIKVELVSNECTEHELPAALCRIVLSNLIRNAFEHTLAGTVSVQVTKLTVIITNTSSGGSENSNISNEQQHTKQLETNSHGFGIGLDIVRKIVTQQGWQFDLSSDQKRGNEVVICFDKQSA